MGDLGGQPHEKMRSSLENQAQSIQKMQKKKKDAATFGCMYAATLGCKVCAFWVHVYGAVGCTYAVAGCKVCDCWVHVYGDFWVHVCGCCVQVYGVVGCMPDSR